MRTEGLNIAVIYGGTSAEREVSLRSGNAVISALNELGVKVTAVDGVENLLSLKIKDFDAVFNILHGEAGENGELAGLLSSLKVKYTGCDVKGAVLSWHKDIAKSLVSMVGINTPTSQTLTKASDLQVIGQGPWIIKPTQEGSSVGLYYADTPEQLKSHVSNALKDVNSILVEDFISGHECTVAIIDSNALPVVRIKPKVGLYDYEAKYESGDTDYFCPSGFDDALESELKRLALLAFNALALKGWARVDFIVDNQNNIWFLEANTTPGMTETSLVPKSAKVHGWSFEELVKNILLTAFDGENDE